ncbi:MAG: hydroxyisourate hydrolase [Williamsia sp.]|nr:hydroxyisourate hydrolase [Williamsia sp.]
MSQLTTHVLDTSRGKPAEGILVILYADGSGNWQEMAKGTTNADGRIADLLPTGILLAAGLYKIKFFTRPYFEQLAVASFYPYVEIVFEISSQAHYHIPLLLGPFGYTTYRGS